jgi:hypothetical protein
MSNSFERAEHLSAFKASEHLSRATLGVGAQLIGGIADAFKANEHLYRGGAIASAQLLGGIAEAFGKNEHRYRGGAIASMQLLGGITKALKTNEHLYHGVAMKSAQLLGGIAETFKANEHLFRGAAVARAQLLGGFAESFKSSKLFNEHTINALNTLIANSAVFNEDFLERISAISSNFDAHSSDEDVEPSTFDNLSEEDIDELNGVIHFVATNSESADEVFEEQISTIKKHNPNLLITLQYILVILNLLLVAWQTGLFVAQRNAYVREQPSSASTVINNINVNQQVFIVDSVPYYYRIRYRDIETREMVEGYLYKNVAKPIVWTDEMLTDVEDDYEDTDANCCEE